MSAALNNRPASIPLQPRPTDTKVCHLPVPGGYVTAIRRKWPKDAVGQCRLCQLCTAYNGGRECLVQFEAYIPEADAPLFSDAGFERAESAQDAIRRPLR